MPVILRQLSDAKRGCSFELRIHRNTRALQHIAVVLGYKVPFMS